VHVTLRTMRHVRRLRQRCMYEAIFVGLQLLLIPGY
jgi:hypothetical protein